MRHVPRTHTVGHNIIEALPALLCLSLTVIISIRYGLHFFNCWFLTNSFFVIVVLFIHTYAWSLQLCTCARVYDCVRACLRVCTCACVSACVSARVCMCMFVRVCACVCLRARACTFPCTGTCIRMYTYNYAIMYNVHFT